MFFAPPSLLCVTSLAQLLAFGAMTSHIALTGVLPRSGLPNEEQRDLLLQLARGLEKVPASRFPDAPNDYIARAKYLLFSVFPPQVGPLDSPQLNRQGEVASRAVACS